MNLKIPYGHGYLEADRPMASCETLTTRLGELASGLSGSELVKNAMENPIGSPGLSELACGKESAVILISDHTRPVPSREILPAMLAELREGSPNIDVTLLVATGCHRLTSCDELRSKLGDEIFYRENIVVHDSRSKRNVEIGTLPSGAPLVIDRTATECDLLVAEGFIEPHFFAGFSGGRKSVLPGICDQKTVMGNHCSAFLADPYARTGVLDGNPIHRDMIVAAQMAKLKFIVNVILNSEHRTVAAFVGDAIRAHYAGCEKLMDYCGVKPQKRGDIVITSNGGAPLDQNLYQAVKGMVTAARFATENGVIIMCAECADGSGSDDFYMAMRGCESAQKLYEHILTIPQDKTQMDQWQYQMLARVLIKHRVIVVTRPELKDMVHEMKMEFAPNLEKAMLAADSIAGTCPHYVIVPDGISVIPML
ncbi:MAG: nickel-dependent lactate racemase [Oscillospiraceae bacterium]